MTKHHPPVAQHELPAQLDRRARLDALAVLTQSNDIARAQIEFLEDARAIMDYLLLIRRFGIH